MERLDYRQLIEKIIQQHAREQSEKELDKVQVVFDKERDSYLLLYVGWREEERIHGCPIHIDIKDGKIWIQQDFTEEGLANQLVELGVPKTDIVLGFRAPYVRQFTGFAVA
ncbi:XisI protein [Microseira wollei]|uniref:XisI protein n=1 Tax=Microseira wollei NIES-4236 TaxID=2530354 RepID=A0AAV3XHI3_9CYAN|nr:XisI protein [Microseira wollei]GET40978.1 XisI protein [Microseira wollei NIES-4236]